MEKQDTIVLSLVKDDRGKGQKVWTTNIDKEDVYRGQIMLQHTCLAAFPYKRFRIGKCYFLWM